MAPPPKTEVTRILRRMQGGDEAASAELLPLVYNELRQLAAARLRHESPGQTLQATALVHEAWLRLNNGEAAELWEDRCRFLGAAAEAMRRIMIEQFRRKQAEKHGGQFERKDLELDLIAAPARGQDLVALDEALSRLEATHPRQAELVKLRYFAGLTAPDAAEVLQISLATAERDWAYARAWLLRELQS